jgi:hypothetical protein
MISVIAHELAELATNPLVNAWYAGEDPTAPTEIGDLCEGLYGTGGGGGYIGQVMRDRGGRTYNLNGRWGKRFLVQWIWSPPCRLVLVLMPWTKSSYFWGFFLGFIYTGLEADELCFSLSFLFFSFLFPSYFDG